MISDLLFLASLVFYFPIVAVIKGVVYTPFVSLVVSVGAISTSVILFPYDVYKACKLVLMTRSIGINTRILCLLLLPIPIILWLPFIVLCCCFVTIGIFLYIVFETYILLMDGNNSTFFSAKVYFYSKTVKSCFSYVKDFWKFSYETFPVFAESMSTPYYEGDVFEIRVSQIFVGFGLGLVALVIDIVPLTVILVVKAIPAVIKVWYNIWAFWVETQCFMFLLFFPFIVATAVTPLLVAIAIPIIILCASVYNLRCVVVMYRLSSVEPSFVVALVRCVKHSMKLFMSTIYDIDDISNRYIFNNSSCLGNFNHEHEITQFNATIETRVKELIPIVTVWNNFFTMCEQYGKQALAEHMCTRDEIETAEPFVILGLPSLVLCRVLKRCRGQENITLSDGTVISNINKPSDYVCTLVYPIFIKLKTDFDSLVLNDVEYKFLETWLFTSGDETKCAGLLPQSPSSTTTLPTYGTITVTSGDRRKQIMHVASQVLNISTMITKFPTFQQNFVSTCNKILNVDV